MFQPPAYTWCDNLETFWVTDSFNIEGLLQSVCTVSLITEAVMRSALCRYHSLECDLWLVLLIIWPVLKTVELSSLLLSISQYVGNDLCQEGLP